MSLRLCQHASLGQQSWPEGKSPTGDHKSQAPAKRSQHFNATYRNILWAQHVVCLWPPRCDMLRYVFRHVGCCWLKFKRGRFLAKYLWMLHEAEVVWPGSCGNFAPDGHAHLFTILHVSKHVATCMATNYKRAQHVVPNKVAIHCSEKLRSFGRSLQMLSQQCCDVLC